MLDSVKKAFVLSLKALKLFYLLAAVNIMINVINFFVIPTPAQAGLSLGKSLLIIALTILFSLVVIFITGGCLAYVKGLIKTGSANLSSFAGNARKYFLSFLAVLLIIMLAFLILGVILFMILGILPDTLKPLTTIIIVAAFIALAVLVLMSPYALVGSDLNVVKSISKGMLIGKKHFSKLLGIMAIMFLVAVVIMAVAGIISGIFSFILRPISGFIAAIIMAIANSAMAVLVNIAYMDYYLKNA